MMDWTDRHCRYLLRLIAPRMLLYTEMVVAEAVIRGDRRRLLRFDPREHPLALQLGGGDPQRLAEAARIGAAEGFDEINLNVGCPSDRVQAGTFGACLMKEPSRVARAVAAMRAAVSIPVTVKSRIGVDDEEGDAFVESFVREVASAGCEIFIVHARKAFLKGLSPKENREVPPLNYGVVWRLKQAHPELCVIANGGIDSVPQAQEQLQHVDGVMVGRAAYHRPLFLAELALAIERTGKLPARADVLESYLPYVARELAAGERLAALTRHLLGLYAGAPGARAFRRVLSEGACRPGAGIGLLAAARRAAEAADAAPPRAAMAG
jgi:tRNA-dihydrouridine synthase A